MLTIVSLYVILAVASLVACLSLNRSDKNLDMRIYYAVMFVLLLFFAAFRNGELLPDYDNYQEYFRIKAELPYVEPSFYTIRSIARFLSFDGDGEYMMFFIYALLGISLKYYAILKYSPYATFSICIWISSMFILHDMIQMRASVASGILLILIPILYQRKLAVAIILMVIAFCFHNSAMFFVILLFLNPHKIDKRFWAACYVAVVVMNLTKFSFANFMPTVTQFLPDMFKGRMANYMYAVEHGDIHSVSMYAPYIMYQTLVCFTTMCFAEKLKAIAPYSIILIKTAFIGVFIYGLSVPGVSMRVAELFSTSLILLTPMLINCMSLRYRKLAGGGIVLLLAFVNLTNFIFLKKFILALP